MQTETAIPSAETLAHWEKKTPQIDPTFTPLAQEQRTHIPTNEAGKHILRKGQTMRGWHCHGDYPIPELRPLVVNGRLAWPVAGIKKLLGVPA